MKLAQTAGKALLASGVMAALMMLGLTGTNLIADTDGLAGQLMAVAVPGLFGVVGYLGATSLLRVEEIGLLRDTVRKRLGRAHLD
jgi:hypothetical protein